MSDSSRLYPKRPLLGVSTAVVDRDKVLLVQRGNAPLKGLWSFPGGLVEPGEKLQDAARRELFEETGIKAGSLKQIDTIEIIDIDPGGVKYHYVLIVFSGVYESGTAKADSDASDVCWIPMHAAKGLELTQGSLEVIKNLTRS